MVAVLVAEDQSVTQVMSPERANFERATGRIVALQAQTNTKSLLVALDQPTIVENLTGKRPVERIVSSTIGRHGSGMQPSNRGRADMFGDKAPVWPFVVLFGLAEPYRADQQAVGVVETYPALALIALGVSRTTPRLQLPKYNPQRKTFQLADWQFTCESVGAELVRLGATAAARWCAEAQACKPNKATQDMLDACICLIVGLHRALGRPCLEVGDAAGRILVPDGEMVRRDLIARCGALGWDADHWISRPIACLGS